MDENFFVSLLEKFCRRGNFFRLVGLVVKLKKLTVLNDRVLTTFSVKYGTNSCQNLAVFRAYADALFSFRNELFYFRNELFSSKIKTSDIRKTCQSGVFRFRRKWRQFRPNFS